MGSRVGGHTRDMTIHTRAAPVEDNVADTADQVTGRLEGTRVLSDVAAALTRVADAVGWHVPIVAAFRHHW